MLQFLQLSVLLLLSASVRSHALECSLGYYETDYCWSPETHNFIGCYTCKVTFQTIADDVVTVAPKLSNGTAMDVEFVSFSFGSVSKLPQVIQESSNQQIVGVKLFQNGISELTSEFLGNAAKNLTSIWSYGNRGLSVAADAFKNSSKLEFLNFNYNGITAFPLAAFRGLHELRRLDLSENALTVIRTNWFKDLEKLEWLDFSHNQLVAIPDRAFEKLHKLLQLSLKFNKIEIVTKKMFKHNGKLQEISLSGNKIKAIQAGTFDPMNQLTYLSFLANKCVSKEFENKRSKEVNTGLTTCYKNWNSKCFGF